jgi:hypothetical protein
MSPKNAQAGKFENHPLPHSSFPLGGCVRKKEEGFKTSILGK